MLTFTAGADNNLIPRAGSFAMAQIAHYCRFYRELEPGAVWLDISSNRFSRWFTPEREIPQGLPHLPQAHFRIFQPQPGYLPQILRELFQAGVLLQRMNGRNLPGRRRSGLVDVGPSRNWWCGSHSSGLP